MCITAVMTLFVRNNAGYHIPIIRPGSRRLCNESRTISGIKITIIHDVYQWSETKTIAIIEINGCDSVPGEYNAENRPGPERVHSLKRWRRRWCDDDVIWVLQPSGVSAPVGVLCGRTMITISNCHICNNVVGLRTIYPVVIAHIIICPWQIICENMMVYHATVAHVVEGSDFRKWLGAI